jgi:hypothetical protein
MYQFFIQLQLVKGKGKVPMRNEAPRYGDVMGEWSYSSKHSWHRHYMKVSGQLHASAALPPGKEPMVTIG